LQQKGDREDQSFDVLSMIVLILE